MPMSTPDGRYWITYNGEVYNYRDLRLSLESRGYTFHSEGDTEVVLNLYVEEGHLALEQLNGMFAFAIWDNEERTLFLARDRMGVKPLYYAVQSGAFYFASEEKALFAAGIEARFDTSTWAELLLFRYVAGEQTPFEGVKRLLPGHYLRWKAGAIQTKRWWSMADRVRDLRESLPDNSEQWFEETLDASVNLRRISDVPVGVLLSGGLDSGSVAASLAKQAEHQVAAFTVTFSDPAFDEGPLAAQVAARWGLDHHQIEVGSTELLNLLRAAARLNDEPLVHGSDLHLLSISRYAKPYVTVLLSGEGADETLGGYVRYQPLYYPRTLNALRPLLPRLATLLGWNGRFRKLGRLLDLGSTDRFVLFNACNILPKDLESLGMKSESAFLFREQVLEEASALYPDEPARQAMYSDQQTFLCSILDRNDRMTMGASIECRVPFLDYRLVETLAALPSSVLLGGGRPKSLLRNSIGARLPREVLSHRKWGFGVPWERHLRDVPEMRDLVRDLPSLAPIAGGPIEGPVLRQVVNEFIRGDNSKEPLVRQLLMLAVWHDECCQTASASAVSL